MCANPAITQTSTRIFRQYLTTSYEMYKCIIHLSVPTAQVPRSQFRTLSCVSYCIHQPAPGSAGKHSLLQTWTICPCKLPLTNLVQFTQSISHLTLEAFFHPLHTLMGPNQLASTCIPLFQPGRHCAAKCVCCRRNRDHTVQLKAKQHCANNEMTHSH